MAALAAGKHWTRADALAVQQANELEALQAEMAALAAEKSMADQATAHEAEVEGMKAKIAALRLGFGLVAKRHKIRRAKIVVKFGAGRTRDHDLHAPPNLPLSCKSAQAGV